LSFERGNLSSERRTTVSDEKVTEAEPDVEGHMNDAEPDVEGHRLVEGNVVEAEPDVEGHMFESEVVEGQAEA